MSQGTPALASAPAPSSAPAPLAKERRLTLRTLLLLLGGAVILFALFIAGFELFDYTESTPFCSLCHVMKPEYTVHRSSPHARTDCGTCHVGPGVMAAIQAKLENARYVWIYPLGRYEKPIKSPITSLRPVEVVCEQCHWPQKFYEDRLRVISDYGQDEANSLTRTQLLMRTGGAASARGQSRGIHWHIDNPVYYIATDEKRQDIPWVQAQYGGVQTEYIAAGSNLTAEFIAKAEKRKMDCVDCHNRATHVFRNPDEALDSALSAGTIPADLPYIKREGLKVLDKAYATEAEAARAIAGVADFYRVNYPDTFAKREADITAAVAALQVIFDNTAFPFMNVTWKTHSDNIGHKDFPGCFRCHDGKHISRDNQVIRLECNICHTIPQVSLPGTRLPSLEIAKAGEPASHRSTTWLAQHRYQFDTTCATCHTIENAGGNDNSSFCSNSACHGTRWTFAGLDAPKVRELSAPSKVPAKGSPGAIPHPIAARTDCLVCHGTGKVRAFPENHASFKIEMCTTCHKPTVSEGAGAPPASTPSAAPTAVPAAPTLAPTVVSPTPTTAPQPSASPTAAPAAGLGRTIPHPLQGRDDCLMCHDLGKAQPFPGDHKGRTNNVCQVCHKPK